MDDPLEETTDFSSRVRITLNSVLGTKHVLVAILLLVNLLNYMDRFTIAGVLTQLQDYFGMNDKDAGMLQTMFVLFYMVCSPFCGFLGDRYSRKNIMIAGLSVWICAVFASSFCGREHFKLFLFLRGLVGVGEASYSTVAPTIIADVFTGATRSTVLMIFYFAVPVGSGLGYIGGAYLSLWTGAWWWGVRFTPSIGIICLVLMVLLLEEPKRGAAEHAELQRSTFIEDLKYLGTVPTFRYTTVALIAVVFAIGSLSWWTPTLIEHAYAIQHGTKVVPESEKASISLMFGLITAGAGLAGVTIGSTSAQAWREGRWGLRASPPADAVVCALGALMAVPTLFIGLMCASHIINLAWFFMFLAVTCMCVNWAINMDMLMYVIVANRRSTATAIQTLLMHLLGDASSPYIIGAISDWIRDDDESETRKFFALQSALFLPNFMLVFGAAFYFYTAFHIVEDQRNAKLAMHVLMDPEEREEEPHPFIFESMIEEP